MSKDDMNSHIKPTPVNLNVAKPESTPPSPPPSVATTVDEYIESQRGEMTRARLAELRQFFPCLVSKSLQAVAEGRYQMVLDIARLKKIASAAPSSKKQHKLPKAWAEAGVALSYLVKGVDLIPDSIEGIGLADDEIIIRRVIERNPKLRDPDLTVRKSGKVRYLKSSNRRK